jgi:hypothetical protein
MAGGVPGSAGTSSGPTPGTTPSTGCSAATNAMRMSSTHSSTSPTRSSRSVASSARHGPSTGGTAARPGDHDHPPVRAACNKHHVTPAGESEGQPLKSSIRAVQDVRPRRFRTPPPQARPAPPSVTSITKFAAEPNWLIVRSGRCLSAMCSRRRSRARRRSRRRHIDPSR